MRVEGNVNKNSELKPLFPNTCKLSNSLLYEAAFRVFLKTKEFRVQEQLLSICII